jgi:hypothetical protein
MLGYTQVYPGVPEWVYPGIPGCTRVGVTAQALHAQGASVCSRLLAADIRSILAQRLGSRRVGMPTFGELEGELAQRSVPLEATRVMEACLASRRHAGEAAVELRVMQGSQPSPSSSMPRLRDDQHGRPRGAGVLGTLVVCLLWHRDQLRLEDELPQVRHQETMGEERWQTRAQRQGLRQRWRRPPAVSGSLCTFAERDCSISGQAAAWSGAAAAADLDCTVGCG